MHVVAVLALDGVSAFDLSIPCQVFALATLPDGSPAYEVRVCADRSVTATAGPSEPFRLSSSYTLDDALGADTVVVPGLPADRVPDQRAVQVLRGAAARKARIASICTGAFILAHAGLLAGRRATTHWRFADALAERYPDTHVDPAVLYVDDGQVLTSAGIAAGLDLCLHMVGPTTAPPSRPTPRGCWSCHRNGPVARRSSSSTAPPSATPRIWAPRSNGCGTN